MIPRTLFTPDHETFRDSVRRFMHEEVVPHEERWMEQGYVDREVWVKAGANGFLCVSMPEQYGGAAADKLYSVVLMEEQATANSSSLGFGLHSEIVAPYLNRYGSEALKAKYLPKMARGEMISAIAMSEPGAGSDLQAIKTTAVKQGDKYIVNGSKTFITNGWHCDLVIVVAKTDPAKGAKGTSLIIVDTSMPGFTKGKRLKKMGLKGQDTSELFFDNVEVPAENLLGQENNGFIYLMPQCSVGRVFVDRCMELLLQDKLDTATASMAKLYASDIENRIIDECLQLHGGYGFMMEFPIARAYVDARVQRIYGGTNEIMKEVISRSLGLNKQ